jgi:D-alanyl-D-alanine carboxypeptidase (penicillin-binding protein 5/6)
MAALALPGAAPATDQPAVVQAAPVPPLANAAPIALLADLSSGQVLYARAANQRFLPASMTKAMTALVAFDLIAAGELREDALITVRPETAQRWAGKGTTLGLRGGEEVSVHDLLMGTTTVSANDAAVALAEGALGSVDAWTAAMNARAGSLGMSGSHFASANGFPDHGRTYVTANDLVRLAAALIDGHPDLYRRYFGHQAMIWRGAALRSHDPFAGVLPGADGIKTGHSYEAWFNFLGSVRRGNRRLVLVIGRVATEPGRAASAKALAEWGYQAWDSRPFLTPGFMVGAAKVQGGTARNVQLGVPRRFALSLPKGATIVQVSGHILYDGPLRAPLAKGQQVARLELQIAGQPVHALPLVTLNAVGEAGPIDRIVNGLLGLLP